MADPYIIPRRLDDPELIGFWTIDEFAGMLAPFTWGILTQHIFIGIIVGMKRWAAKNASTSFHLQRRSEHNAFLRPFPRCM